MGIYLTYKERYKETAEIQKIETVIEKEINVLKWWQKLFITFGILFICLVVIKIWLNGKSLLFYIFWAQRKIPVVLHFLGSTENPCCFTFSALPAL